MLKRTGNARHTHADRNLAWSLAAIAGALNTAGFYAMALFSSNMTGNVATLADRVALGELRPAAMYLALVASFVAGAAVSAVLIGVGRRRGVASIYAFSIVTEAVLLGVLAGADRWLPGGVRLSVLAYGLCFLMGLQNAVVTRISNARIRTTHVTGMITDIGIEIGNLVDLAFTARPARGASEFNLEKLRLHGVTVLAFLAGGIGGVLAYRAGGPFFFLGMACVLLLIAMPSILRPGRG